MKEVLQQYGTVYRMRCAQEVFSLYRCGRKRAGWRAVVGWFTIVSCTVTSLRNCDHARRARTKLAGSTVGWSMRWSAPTLPPSCAIRSRRSGGWADQEDRSIDARGLANLLRNGTLSEVWIPASELRDQRELVRLRIFLVHLRTRAKTRIHGTLRRHNTADMRPKWDQHKVTVLLRRV
jgi:transposase